MKNRWPWIVLFLILVLAVIAAYFIGYGAGGASHSSVAKTYNDARNFPLLAKRIFIENPNDPQINFEPLRKQLKEYVANNNLTSSVYFEYLPTGTSVRVDGEEQKTAASLIKLPAAMELYKAAELGKLNLDDNIKLKEEWLDSKYGDLYKKGSGHTLTIREAAKIMLQQSDNTALKAVSATLANLVPQEQSPFNSLDVDISRGDDLSVLISAKSYSSFFKCLHFACYNSKEHSQEILDNLTNTPFDNRLIAGLDGDNLTVAHKIGVYGQITQSDCGIFYIEKRNYILCAMINGPDNAETNSKLADISRLTYQYVKNL